ncbi:MAG: serine--tRNA ligase, partial [Solirubrobacteraceae bacterium]
MLDIKLIRSEPAAVRAALARRGEHDGAMVDRVLALDERWRAVNAQLEELRAEQNKASRGRTGAPTPQEREQLAALATRGRALSDEEATVRAEREQALASLPNLPSPEAPLQDTVLKTVGVAGLAGKDHL